MKKGKLPYHNLKTSVLQKIVKLDKKNMLPRVGQDYAVANGIITSDGYGKSPVIAWTKAMNNLSTSLTKIVGARVLLLLSEQEKDSKIKEYMEQFFSLSKEWNIQIVGGHSEVLDEISQSSFAVTMFGNSQDCSFDKKAVNADYDVVMAGYTGALGQNLIIKEKKEMLNERFSERFLEMAIIDEDALCIKPLIDVAVGCCDDIAYVHDVSSGGVYKALFELGEFLNRGLKIENNLIPIRQETIEICDYLDINPYLLEGTGAVLFVISRGRTLVEGLRRTGFEASIIGKISDGKEKLVALNINESRVIEGNTLDEILKI